MSLLNEQWFNNKIKIKESSKLKIDRNLIDNRKELNVLEYGKMFNELYNFMQQKKKSYFHYQLNNWIIYPNIYSIDFLQNIYNFL